jgi:hypothetical protein
LTVLAKIGVLGKKSKIDPLRGFNAFIESGWWRGGNKKRFLLKK